MGDNTTEKKVQLNSEELAQIQQGFSNQIKQLMQIEGMNKQSQDIYRRIHNQEVQEQLKRQNPFIT